MDFGAICINSFWAGGFSAGWAVLLTAPYWAVVPGFLCGFAGRFVRDVLIGWGVSQNWATVAAAAVVVLVATSSLIRQRAVSPVVLVTGILPLGAALAMFNMIIELMKVSSLKGEALSESSVALSANMGKVFATTLAIALGLEVGISLVRLFGWDEVRKGV